MERPKNQHGLVILVVHQLITPIQGTGIFFQCLFASKHLITVRVSVLIINHHFDEPGIFGIFRLIYISTPKAETGLAERQNIIRSALRNNKRDNITGVLVQDSTRFLQYLEGEQSVVEQTFNRISSDPRHFAIMVLKTGTIARRQFPNWAMASKSIENNNSLKSAVAKLVVGCDPEVVSDLLNFAEARDQTD